MFVFILDPWLKNLQLIWDYVELEVVVDIGAKYDYEILMGH
jgi:hypothetical protein